MYNQIKTFMTLFQALKARIQIQSSIQKEVILITCEE